MPADPQSLLLWLLPLLALTGLVAGVLAGLLGVGGGIVVVPVLYYVFGALGIDPAVRMHLAVGTSLATIIPTSLRSARAHYARGAVDPELLRSWAPAMFCGAVIGAGLAALASFRELTAVFGTVALAVSLHMSLGSSDWRIAQAPPAGPRAWPLAGVIGGVSAMMGIGGGTLSVPVLTLLGLPIHRAVGTAAAFGMVISVPAMVGFVAGGWGRQGLPPFSAGYVNLAGFAVIVPMTLLAAPLGARLAHWLSQRRLRQAFALFLGVTALRMLWDVFVKGA
jgi:uncharacterized membrane protein YfcA